MFNNPQAFYFCSKTGCFESVFFTVKQLSGLGFSWVTAGGGCFPACCECSWHGFSSSFIPLWLHPLTLVPLTRVPCGISVSPGEASYSGVMLILLQQLLRLPVWRVECIGWLSQSNWNAIKPVSAATTPQKKNKGKPIEGNDDLLMQNHNRMTQ